MIFTKYLVTYYEYDQDGNCKDGPKIFKKTFDSEKDAKDFIKKDMNSYKKSMKKVVDMIIDCFHVHDKNYRNGCIYNCIEIDIDCQSPLKSISIN